MQLALEEGDVQSMIEYFVSMQYEQFEKRWWKLINRFELKNDEWVQSLYEDRKKWVPTFMQDISLAGLSTTVSFDMEAKADFETKQKQPALRTAHRVQRFNDLCRQAIILSEIGSLSEDTYRVASQALEEIYKHCVNANNFARSTLESNKLVLNGFDVEEKNDGCHRAKPTKKRKSFNKRECSDPERIKIKMLDDFQKRD
ncbi:Protein FAR1-RELATED SEQUENCE 1 [Glycine soja]|uniref:Protein FAR1-RELATED SEQUENCE n=1 Tax=Glycine soja TaxID=3848 RepID=A0A0B2PDD6_GLYSO|nr:Protein FAR1-RELATED SEQUENCE 1 [Glycine soja]